MTRTLALDVGDRRIGLAMSDPEGILASPLKVLERKDDKEDIEAVVRIIEREGVSRVIIGLPRSLSGRFSEQTRKVESFVSALKDYVKVPVEKRDERFSTVEAKRLMKEAGGRKKEREMHDDAIAAAVILQGYLDEVRESPG